MPAEARHAPAGAAAAGIHAAFKQAHFAQEAADWLAHRATAAEAQRFDRYMQLIQQAAGAPASSTPLSSSQLLQQQSASAAQPKTHSSLDFCAATGRKNGAAAAAGSSRPATASPGNHNDGSSWQYSTTKRAAAAAATQGMKGQGSALMGQGLRPFSAAAAVPAATAAQRPSAAATTTAAGADQSPGCSSPLSGGGSNGPRCVNVTTAQAFHGLKELYPDLWAATAPICRPAAAPNKNFVSEWGESLRQGADEAWAPYLASSYQVANLQVAKPTDEFALRADAALVGWAAQQKLYFGDLLSPQAAAAVAGLLEGRQPAAAAGAAAGEARAAAGRAGALPLADRKGLVDMLRQLSSVVQPDSTQSLSHTAHKPQYSVEQPGTTCLMREQTRLRTMGCPRKVEVKGFAHAATKTAAAAAAAPALQRDEAAAAGSASSSRSSSNKPGRPAVKASDMIDTLSSKVPLKWAASSVVAPGSSYTAAFGSNPGRSPQMCKTVFKEVNVGFGHVDQLQYPTRSALYPVEQRYLQPSPVPGRVQHDADLKTTNRMSYKPRDPDSVARSVAAAREQIEASQSVRNKSFIPLSKAGIQLGSSAQWCSSYGADFLPSKTDLSANKAMAAAVSNMFNGPTIAWGKIAGTRAGDAAGIAKWNAQQEAAAAAKAAAEAALDRRAAAGAAAGAAH
ncbi:hypothetical protein COO60DRAFT_1074463 [Scenedesmus sp. NREL 46B-D3]|nr:hypothetical protein COO60DRAFT_1074463 [Scenedesmus sp. NREL 46B-D3]